MKALLRLYEGSVKALRGNPQPVSMRVLRAAICMRGSQRQKYEGDVREGGKVIGGSKRIGRSKWGSKREK